MRKPCLFSESDPVKEESFVSITRPFLLVTGMDYSLLMTTDANDTHIQLRMEILL